MSPIHTLLAILATILYTGLIASLLCFGFWAYLVQRYSPNRVAPFSLLVPIFGLGFSVVLLDDPLSHLELMGAILVFLGLCLTILTSPRDPLNLPNVRNARALVSSVKSSNYQSFRRPTASHGNDEIEPVRFKISFLKNRCYPALLLPMGWAFTQLSSLILWFCPLISQLPKPST